MSVLVKRVVVGVDGSPGSLLALRRAAYEALRHQAELCPVLVWELPGGDAPRPSKPTSFPALDALCRRCEKAAEKRLAAACDAALADVPDGLRLSPAVLRGQPGPALVACSRHDTDLLVLGVGGHRPGHRFRRRSARRYCLKHARCPVLIGYSAVQGGCVDQLAPPGPAGDARGRGVGRAGGGSHAPAA
ncbi:universal stress protein [Kitasatospora sp. NBC_01250]|uniref:universal stress protein n=1 Tax=unclassified Kitasatospora TaxID=2633591 RepID=UPI002E141AF8|nr:MULTISPECIES: universal stress protein [unclassified Kitasatospora]WSJ71390.1 universal stress protein [Kitasatospora sp. NBC_01302]